jgi:transposase-like protein
MHNRSSSHRVDAAEHPGAPSQCPVCSSPDVKTASKTVTAESYWRCVACGEVWNAGRRNGAAATGASPWAANPWSR